MTTNSDIELRNALDNYTVTVLKNSNPYATKESISRRVLQECAEIMNIDLNSYTNKNIMYIHRDNMDKIDLKWQSLAEEGKKILHDEQNTYKLLKSSDFVNILDVQKFINILSNKNEEDFLAELLAMDGFQGLKDHKNYVENLKIGDKGSDDHIQIIREIYRKFKVPVKVVYFTLLKMYENYTTDEEVQKFIAKLTEELSTEMVNYNIDDITEFYENAINSKSLELKSIALTKLAQVKNQKKKSKATKRKLKVKFNVKEKKKPKEAEEEVEE